MTLDSAAPNRTEDELPCATIVYRAVTRKPWIDPETGRPTNDVYLRVEKDKGGISVNLFERFPLDDKELRAHIYSVTTNEPHSLLSLHVGHIQSIRSAITPDARLCVIPDSNIHANINAVPPYQLPFIDEADAEFWADRLAKMSRVRWFRVPEQHWLEVLIPLERS